jgi:hypothetical protein
VYIGHIGAALAAKRVRVSIGLLPLLVATYAPDLIDTGMCAASRYNPMLSHSIPAVMVLALAGSIWYALVTRDRIGGVIVGAVVVSHMFLDWVTGVKPTWPGGPAIGLHLYDHPIADFAAEGVVIVIGALLYARTLPPRQRPWADVSIMLGALLVLQLSIDVAHVLLQNLPKC